MKSRGLEIEGRGTQVEGRLLSGASGGSNAKG